MSSFKKLDLNHYSSQVASNNAGPYVKDNYEGLGLNALGKGKYVGSMNPGYHASGGAPRSVEAMVYSNRVSPVYPWSGAGNTKPQSTLGVPANPYIPLMMDFNSMDLYTYEGVKTPGAEKLWEKNFIYENAPIRSHWPQTDRNYNAWGKEAVSGSNYIYDYNVCRPVMGLPFRIQRIPICVNTEAPLISLSGEPVALDGGDGSGSSTAVSGYFYALATDPVIFTKSGDITSDQGDPEVYNGTTAQWISDSGFLPLSTTCAGGAGATRISGVSCDTYTSYDCIDVDCLAFNEADFGLTEGDNNTYTLHSRGISITQTSVELAPCPTYDYGGAGCQRGWPEICEYTKDPDQTEASLEITYSIMIAGTIMGDPKPAGDRAGVFLENHAPGGNASHSVFISQIEQAFEEWRKIFEHLYPWLTLTFTNLGSETSNTIPSDTSAGLYDLPQKNIGDLRIGMHRLDFNGGVLAHAYFPDVEPGTVLGLKGSVAGDLHYCSADNWFSDDTVTTAGFSIKYVTVHELGHALGITYNGNVHSDNINSVMYKSIMEGARFDLTFPGGLVKSTIDVNAVSQVYSATMNSVSAGGDGVGAGAPTPPIVYNNVNNILLGNGFRAGGIFGGSILGENTGPAGCGGGSGPGLELYIDFPEIAGMRCHPSGCVGDAFQSPFNTLKFNESDFRIKWDHLTCSAEIFTCDGLFVSGLNSSGDNEVAININQLVLGDGIQTEITNGVPPADCPDTPIGPWSTFSVENGRGLRESWYVDVPEGECGLLFRYLTADAPDGFEIYAGAPWGEDEPILLHDTGMVSTREWIEVLLPTKPSGITTILITQTGSEEASVFSFNLLFCELGPDYGGCACDDDLGIATLTATPLYISGVNCITQSGIREPVREIKFENKSFSLGFGEERGSLDSSTAFVGARKSGPTVAGMSGMPWFQSRETPVPAIFNNVLSWGFGGGIQITDAGCPIDTSNCDVGAYGIELDVVPRTRISGRNCSGESTMDAPQCEDVACLNFGDGFVVDWTGSGDANISSAGFNVTHGSITYTGVKELIFESGIYVEESFGGYATNEDQDTILPNYCAPHSVVLVPQPPDCSGLLECLEPCCICYKDWENNCQSLVVYGPAECEDCDGYCGPCP